MLSAKQVTKIAAIKWNVWAGLDLLILTEQSVFKKGIAKIRYVPKI